MILTRNTSDAFDGVLGFGPFSDDAVPSGIIIHSCTDETNAGEDAHWVSVSAFAVERAEVDADRDAITVTADEEKQGVALLRNVQVGLSNRQVTVGGTDVHTTTTDLGKSVFLPIDGRLCVGRFLKVVIELGDGGSARTLIAVALKGW